NACIYLADGNAALALAERAYALPDDGGPECRFLQAFIASACRVFVGAGRDADEPLARALELVQQDPLGGLLPHHRVWRGVAIALAGRCEAALAFHRQYADELVSRGETGLLPYTFAHITEQLINLGRLVEANAAATQGVSLARVTGQRGELCKL